MTWFLETQDREARADAPRDRRVIRGSEARQAARQARAVEVDYWAQTRRRREALVGEMVEALGGVDAIAPTTPDDMERTRQWTVPQGIGDLPTRPDDWGALFEGQPVDRQIDWLMERAGPAAASDPARWGSRPLDRAQFEAELKKRQMAELREAQEVLAGHDGWLNPLIGALTIDATDEVTLPFWLVGGNPLRAGAFVTREILLGAAAEIAALPKEQRQAARLELEQPDALERIAMGMLAGGVLGGTIAAGARGVEYLRLRGRTEAEQAPGAGASAAAQRAENDIRAGQDPEVPQVDAPGADLTDADIVSRIIGVESGGNPVAQNPQSTARGLGQFIAGTWMDMITRHRPDLVAGRTRAQVLALRDDPTLNREMTTLYMQENRARLQSAGVPTDPGALYLAHFMGLGGAIRALRAAPDTPIASLMTAAEIRANAAVRHGGRSFAQFTAADLRSWSSAKMGRPAPRRAAGGASAAAGVGAPDAAGARFDFGQPTSRPMTRFDEVVTPAGTRVPVEYRVVDLDSLTPARGEFQPRDRTRAGSDEQVAEIAARLDAMRLMPSPEADRGAPIVGPDMMVESGNGRVMALRRAAEQHPDRFDAYREAISAAGFDVPEGMTRPALVAMRQGDMTPAQRRAFVAEANDSGTMRMATAEQAGRDADFLSGNVFDAYRPGQPVAQQGEFLRRLLGQMPQSERAAMVTADGQLNPDGLRRVRQALFARAYGAPDLLRLLAENPDPRLRAMLDMLDDLAPDWAAFRSMVESGYIRADFDITEPMVDIVRIIARTRTEGRDGQGVIAAIRDKLAQADMFAARNDDLTEALLATFYKGNRARRPLDAGDILRRYVADAQTVGRADVDDLFGVVESSADVLRRSVQGHETKAEYAAPAPRAAEDVSVPTAEMDPAPMLDGAASPVLVRADDATEDAMRAAVAGDTAPAVPALDAEPDLSAVAQMPKTMETAQKLVDMANMAAPRGYRFKIEDNDIWLSAPDGDLRASRFLDINISPLGITYDLQRAIDIATENASGGDAIVRSVTLPDDVDPAAVRAARDALWDDPAAANMTPEQEIVEAVRRARAAGSDAAEAPASQAAMVTLRPGDPFGARGKIEGVNDAALYRDTAPSRAWDVVRSDMGSVSETRSTGPLFWADDPDLAIGQGGSTGIILRAREGSLGVSPHDKPVPGEFTSYAAAPNALTEIVAVTQDAADAFLAKMTPAWRQRFDKEWQQVPDASFNRVTDQGAYPAVWQRRDAAPASTPGPAAARASSLTSAQRSEIEARAQQSRVRRLDGNTGGEGPLFDTQGDLLAGAQRAADAPAATAAPTPATQGEVAATAAAAREFAALRDLTVRLDPDGPEVRVADMLDDLRENATLSDAVASCVTRRGG
jgi:hypothetical protein